MPRPLYVEPLEDRQLLSALHPGGEYAKKPSPATAEYKSASPVSEYSHASPAATAPERYARPISYDTTPSSANQSAGTDPTPGDAGYASADATPDYVETYATPAAPARADAAPAENTLRAASVVVQQTARPEANAAPATPPAAHIAAAAAGVPVAGPERPAAGGGPIGEAARLALERTAFHAARPAADVTDAVPAAGIARGVEVDPGTEEPFDPGTEVETPAAQVADLLQGTATVDLQALTRGLDQFFSRLEELGQELPSGPLFLRLAPWLVTVSVATAGLELARWQMKKQSPRRSARIGRLTPVKE